MNDEPNLRQIANAELYPDEKLLWVGKPSPMRIVTQYAHRENLISGTIITVIFVVFLFTGDFFGLSSIRLGNLQIPLFSLVLIPIVGLLLFTAYTYWRAGQMVYAITKRRALIIKHTLDGKSVLAYNVMPSIERRDLANGKGDLIFASETYSPLFPTNYYSSGNYNYRVRKVGFFGIDNAYEVEQLLFTTFVKRGTVNEH